jgi:hypothetical protein
MSGNCGITFYVEAPDVEAAFVQAEKLGGTRLTAPSEVQPRVEARAIQRPGRTHGRTARGPGISLAGQLTGYPAPAQPRQERTCQSDSEALRLQLLHD